MGAIAKQEQAGPLPAGRQPRPDREPQWRPQAGGGQTAPKGGQGGRTAAGPALRPGGGSAGPVHLLAPFRAPLLAPFPAPLLQPAHPDAALGRAEQGVAALLPDQGDEALGQPGLQQRRGRRVQFEPEHLQARGFLLPLQLGLAAQAGSAAITGHHQIGAQLAAVLQHHALDAAVACLAIAHRAGRVGRRCGFGIDQQPIHRLSRQEREARAGQGLLEHAVQQRCGVDQGAGGRAPHRFSHRKQGLAFEVEAPAGQLPLRQARQQGGQAHALQGFEAAGHQAIAAQQPLVLPLALHQLHSHPGAGQQQGEGGAGWTGPHHQHPQRLGQLGA